MFDEPILGFRTVTMDSFVVGPVVALSDGKFAVQTDAGPKWLRREAIFTAAQGVIALVCNRSHLTEYEVPGPSDDETRIASDHEG